MSRVSRGHRGRRWLHTPVEPATQRGSEARSHVGLAVHGCLEEVLVFDDERDLGVSIALQGCQLRSILSKEIVHLLTTVVDVRGTHLHEPR